MKRKQLLINEKEFKELKKIFRKGIYSNSSDSLFIRDLIEYTLNKELKK